MSEKFDPFKDPEHCADMAEFWARGGEIPKSHRILEIYDHRVTDVANSKNLRKVPSDGLGVESEK